MTNTRFLVVALLLLFGILVSVVFGKLGHPFASTAYRAPKAPLQEFPTAIGGWKGTDEDLGDRVQEIAGMDQHLNRIYEGPDGKRALLYIAYYGNRQRGLRTIYHNPTVCLPSSGWTELGARKDSVKLESGPHPEIGVTIHGFEQRGLQVAILSFYIVDGKLLDGPPRNRPDELAVQKLTMSFDPGYYVKVNVIAVGERRFDLGRQVCLDFLKAAGPYIFRHF